MRAQAVAAVLKGEQPAKVAKRFGISQGLLHGWCEQDLPPIDIVEVSRSDIARARTRQLIAETIYDCTIDFFAALRLQLQAAGRDAWLKEQNAADVATLMGTEIDGAIRLLAGFRANGDEQSDDTIDGEAAG